MFRLASWIGLCLCFESHAELIYQVFNERFVDTEKHLVEIQKQGYTALLLPPPQKSLPQNDWWARYQPIDYSILDSPLGDEVALSHLIQKAKELNIKVFIDAVLNHMADVRFFPNLVYPQFTAKDFHFPAEQPVIRESSDRFEITHFWLNDFRAKLPDLDTSSEYVRKIHSEYLNKLVSLGVEGFRFDAAGNIEPEYFDYLIPLLPKNGFYFGEIIDPILEDVKSYSRNMKVTHYSFLGKMIQTFSIGGDLRSLRLSSFQEEPWIYLVRNQDTALNDGFFRFADPKDSILAYSYLLAQNLDSLLVFQPDADQGDLSAGIKFYNLMKGIPSRYLNGSEFCENNQSTLNGIEVSCDHPDFAVVWRENLGFSILNKSSSWLKIEKFNLPGLISGNFEELTYHFSIHFDQNQSAVTVGPRTSLFFIKRM